VSIVGFEDEQNNPAFAAGLRLYDNIIKINGKEISGNTDVTNVVSGGGEIALTFLRAGKEKTVKVTPRFSEAEKRYTLGLWLKDSGAGIGTLTYVTSDGYFGGLGHGICDGDTGELVPITSGSVLGVTLNGIVKGQRGAPGELKGYFNSSKIGAIFKNSDVGVFGALAQIPDSIKEKTYSIGLKGELREGKATVLCTLDDNVRREYSIEISNINRNSDGNKCFNIKQWTIGTSIKLLF
jgi:stage IV sporulation protein B